MRIGIIAEGRGDLAVISNILRGHFEIESEDIQFLLPEYELDQTDLHEMPEEQFSNWGLVKKECTTGTLIDGFLSSPIDEERLVVIQIDTAEVELVGYDVVRPQGSGHSYTVELHGRVAAKLDEWLAGRAKGRACYAIAVEETEAWILTRYQQKDTSTHRDPKKALHNELNRSLKDKERKRLFQLSPYELHDKLSQDFRKPRRLQDYATRNVSLRLFLEALSSTVENLS